MKTLRHAHRSALPNRASGQGGFTLFELLLVVCILAILCGLALSRFNVKETTEGAWGIVNESAYRAAKTALAKSLAEDPANPPTAEELAAQIDSKMQIYQTNCDNIGSPTPASDFCLGIDINKNEVADPGEVFAALYRDSDCEVNLANEDDEVCCLDRPFFDASNTPTLTYFAGSFG